ncbi:hypothetical protein ACEPAF_7343 [Sanghuangporus sanghuang]
MSAPTTAFNPSNPMDLYEPLDIIGNGSFGIIRKVRRKSDGEILARKELKFERMSERDRKQIVAEVNILKDLHHENIVRYIDRHVDKEAGILYILMEYCDGGDLTSIIKQCSRVGRPVPEDVVWSYFLQLLLALQHCHCPTSSPGEDGTSEIRRQQILHRDLKPENVFISKGKTIKLGDFGLSKALTQTNFANTYVGTPYYMSPELIQEKSYDTKSDIWSLGCLIYELCALRPPFAEAQTHSELSMLIRNARIPPLPKGYSSSLSHVIKSMLNLNPAMRPSAQQLLQHERIDFARKVADTEKMLQSVKTHKANVIAKERELQNLSTALAQRETTLSTTIAQKDSEIARLNALVSQAEERTKRAIAAREEELCSAVMRREEEVRTAMAKREEEILDAVRKREEEINTAWQKREEQLRSELQSAMQWVQSRQKELAEEAQKIDGAKMKLAKEREQIQQTTRANRNEKKPLEDVKNLIAPSRRMTQEETGDCEATPRRPEANLHRCRSLETPTTSKPIEDKKEQTVAPIPGSAMRGVILTATGEALKTPAPFTHTASKANVALTNIIKNTPAVGLNFRKIFDFAESESSDDENGNTDADDAESVTGTLTTTSHSCASSVAELNSPTKDVTARRRSRGKDETTSSSGSISARAKMTVRRHSSTKAKTTASALPVPKSSPQKVAVKKASQSAQTKARRPSTRTSGRPSIPTSASTPALFSGTRPKSTLGKKNAPLPSTPYYDPSDEENLPSPFLRRVERGKMTRVSAVGLAGKGLSAGRRKSAHNLLRAKAAANAVNNAQAQTAANAPIPVAKESKSS